MQMAMAMGQGLRLGSDSDSEMEMEMVMEMHCAFGLSSPKRTCPQHKLLSFNNARKPGFPQETPVWRHCLSLPQCAVYFASHPPTPEPTLSQTDLLTVLPHTGAARSCPSDDCLSYTVPVA